MENIILKQHSPIVVLANSHKSNEKEFEYKKSKSTGVWWIIAGIIVLIVIIVAIVSNNKKDS